MIRSMTGYGESASHERGVHSFLEVRSLNSKYFKAVIRLPDEFQGLEAELESELRRRLTRGTVTLTARTSEDAGGASHRINQDVLNSYVEQIKGAAGLSGMQVHIDAAALLALPGVLQPPADEEERIRRVRASFLALLDKSCAQLVAMREREGRALLADLLSLRDLITSRLERIRLRAPAVVLEYEQRLRQRIDMLLQGSNLRLEPSDLIREIAVYAEKSDIAEELARLAGHIAQFTDLLSQADGQPIGRTLDFLAQEMLREANTIASKSGDSEIARDIVEVKGAIDRIKEQVQNVE